MTRDSSISPGREIPAWRLCSWLLEDLSISRPTCLNRLLEAKKNAQTSIIKCSEPPAHEMQLRGETVLCLLLAPLPLPSPPVLACRGRRGSAQLGGHCVCQALRWSGPRTTAPCYVTAKASTIKTKNKMRFYMCLVCVLCFKVEFKVEFCSREKHHTPVQSSEC